MAVQDQPYAGFGVRTLTPEEKARIQAQQAQYQLEQVARQAQSRQQFDGVMAIGAANQTGRPQAPMVSAQPAPVPPVAAQVPTVETPVAPPSTPAPTPARTNEQVLAQDRANVQNFVRSQPGYAGPTAEPSTLSPDILADANQRIAQTLQNNQPRGPMPGASAGVFNQQTTSTVNPDGSLTSTLRKPDNIIEGGYGGFGIGGSQAGLGPNYAADMKAKDAAAEEARLTRQQVAYADVERIGLRNQMERGDPFERRAARDSLASLDARQAQTVGEFGASRRAGVQTDAELAKAGISAAAGLTAAQMEAAARGDAASIAGEYGLAAAQAKAQAAQGAAAITATSPQAALAQQRAQLIAEQLRLGQLAEQNGDLAGQQSAYGIKPSKVEVVRDNITGMPRGTTDARGVFRPYTAEELAIIRQTFSTPSE